MRGELPQKPPEPTARGSRRPDGDVSRLSTPELMARIAQDAQGLVKAEINLAKTELRADLHGLLATVRRGAVAIVLLAAGVAMLLATAVLALCLVLPAWAAALVVSGALLVSGGIAATWAARGRSKAPLERTRRNLKENLQWAKEIRT
jgi:uncharacterized membrane protein YqjE